MSRRQGVPWAATSVPEIRRQWCNALDHTAERFTSEGLSPPEPGTPGSRRLERMQSKLAAEMEIMKAETRAIGEAEMFWVARDMVDTALDAAATLPEWTPALACPTPNGLLCWAKPAGTVPFGPRPTATTDVPWDAVWWWMRPDGMLHMSPSSRLRPVWWRQMTRMAHRSRRHDLPRHGADALSRHVSRHAGHGPCRQGACKQHTG